ncbi:hypothetical protein [Pseudonocardia sp. ICBG1293]|uniref:hypothetical protein n=1 Tax=Pseudonocardia sp. ICBG1293 TaxID=2844382 RepID=UPI001CCB7EF9|nr:hypothetical protein [Pseudonocardia sp. ICBG1293]
MANWSHSSATIGVAARTSGLSVSRPTSGRSMESGATSLSRDRIQDARIGGRTASSRNCSWCRNASRAAAIRSAAAVVVVLVAGVGAEPVAGRSRPSPVCRGPGVARPARVAPCAPSGRGLTHGLLACVELGTRPPGIRVRQR